jgi:aspartokinase/homoserine dehydrogenase 1
MRDIQLKRFLPDGCFQAASISEFYSKLREYDAILLEIRKEAHSQDKKLRYIASFENGKAMIFFAIGWTEASLLSPFRK